MCGRYIFTPGEKYFDRFDISNRIDKLLDSYNVSPSQSMPVVVRNSPNKSMLMKWGLSPIWMKGKSGLINARAETITEKPMFKSPFQKRRCLVPANGFYEWKKTEKGKVPYFIHLKSDELFAFAGIYDEHEDAGNKKHQTYAIITSTPNELMKDIHDRMPVILTKKEEDIWLDPESDEDVLLSLLDSFPASDMDAYTVSRDVNSPQNNIKDLLKKVDYPEGSS